jgi:hypothetical protein
LIRRRVIVVHAVEQKLIRRFARAADVEAAAKRKRRTLRRWNRAGNKQGELLKFAPVERQSNDFFL